MVSILQWTQQREEKDICKWVRVICKWDKSHLQMGKELSANGIRVICKWVRSYLQMG
jgi:hypothetical protein